MARTKNKDAADALDFEKAIARLEEIVRKLEEEEISLETSLKLYEEGLRLQRACERRLQEADNRIKQLIESPDGAIAEEPFEPQPGEAATQTAGDDDADDDVKPASPPAARSKDDLPF